MSNGSRGRVGELRPSQILFSYGVGSVIDLPHISAMVMGLDDWNKGYAKPVPEERLLEAVRGRLGNQVEQLLHPPMPPSGDDVEPLSPEALIGVPLAAFPQWLRCPQCDLLAPIGSELFRFKHDAFHTDRSRFEHTNCPRKVGARLPAAVPARFLAACTAGHIDDFPWRSFVHQGATGCTTGRLVLRKVGPSDEAADLQVECVTCGAKRRMSQAFGERGEERLPKCSGRHPHLRDAEQCAEEMRPILLGASNSWFPVTLSALSLPSEGTGKLAKLVDEHWHLLKLATSIDIVVAFQAAGNLHAFGDYDADAIWDAVKSKRAAEAAPPADDDEEDLKTPEWRLLAAPDPSKRTDDFEVRVVAAPKAFERYFEETLRLERLREVRALLGFTRIEASGELTDEPAEVDTRRVKLARKGPFWVPASEVRGEGIFLRLKEDEITRWCSEGAVKDRETALFAGHRAWRRRRGLQPLEEGFPGIRHIMLHSFAHALMRQLALSAGYTAASIRERIYARDPALGDPMAGVLLYTAAPDSEGTLGGLVALGDPDRLGRIIGEALEHVRICASDPLCAEHDPSGVTGGLHGAACHACLFAPETSCELANRYLDRTLLVQGFHHPWPAFFSEVDGS